MNVPREISALSTHLRAGAKGFWIRSSGGLLLRFAVFLLIIAATLLPTMIASLDKYRYAFVELEMTASQRGAARLFIDKGTGYLARNAVRVRIERSIIPETYRFRIPAEDVAGLRLEPSHKPGSVEIMGARVVNSNGGILQELDLGKFKYLEGPIELTAHDGRVQIEIAEFEKPSSRIQISDDLKLAGLRQGMASAILLWVAVVAAGAGILAGLLRQAFFTRLQKIAVGLTDWIETSGTVRRRAILLVISWCGAIGLLVILTVAVTQHNYFENHPYFYDPVTYSVRDISLYLEVKDQPRVAAAITEAMLNDRYPLRTIPLILTAPSVLAHPLGHMVTGGMVFLMLLVCFCWTVFKGSGSLLYGLAATALLAALPWHFDCRLGLGAYWLDTVSAYFLLLSALALINWERGGGLWWVAGFAAFASCSVLSRYVSIAYVLFVCGPLFVFAMSKRTREGGRFRESIGLPLIVSGCIVGVLAMPYLIAHLHSNREYYSSFGYALGSTPIEAFNAIVKNICLIYLRLPMLLVLTILLVVQLLMFGGLPYRRVFAGAAGPLWVFIGILLCQVFVIRTVVAIHQFGYITLLFVFTCLSPVPWSNSVSKARKIVISLAVVLCSIFIGVGAAQENRRLSKNPSAEAKALKKLDLDLANGLLLEDPGVVWTAFFDEHWRMPAIEAFLIGGALPGHPTAQTFSVHEKYITTWYPDKTREEICEAVLQAVNAEVNIAVVPLETERINTLFNNDYSRAISLFMTTTLAADDNWEPAFRINTPHFGELVGYRNRRLERSRE